MEPRHHCANRNFQDVGDLAVGQLFDVGQQHDQTPVGSEGGKRALDRFTGQTAQGLCLRAGRRGLAISWSERIVVDVVG